MTPPQPAESHLPLAATPSPCAATDSVSWARSSASVAPRPLAWADSWDSLADRVDTWKGGGSDVRGKVEGLITRVRGGGGVHMASGFRGASASALHSRASPLLPYLCLSLAQPCLPPAPLPVPPPCPPTCASALRSRASSSLRLTSLEDYRGGGGGGGAEGIVQMQEPDIKKNPLSTHKQGTYTQHTFVPECMHTSSPPPPVHHHQSTKGTSSPPPPPSSTKQ